MSRTSCSLRNKAWTHRATEIDAEVEKGEGPLAMAQVRETLSRQRALAEIWLAQPVVEDRNAVMIVVTELIRAVAPCSRIR